MKLADRFVESWETLSRFFGRLRLPAGAARWIHSLVVAVAMVGVVVYGLGFVWHWIIDDSGISFAYARHLVDGQGLVAMPGGYNVEGYSNFLWVAILTVVEFFGFWLPSAAKVLGSALGFLVIVLCVGIVQRLTGRKWSELRWEDLTPALMLGWAESFVVWMPSGLENMLFASLLMATVLLDLRERDEPGRFPLSALTALGVALTRPEGILYAAAFGGLKLIDALADRRYLRQMLEFALCSLGGILSYHAWHFWQFSEVFPNTYYAKNPGMTAKKFEGGWEYFKKAIDSGGYLYLLPLAVLGGFERLRRIAGILVVIAAGSFFVLFSGGDWMPHERFLSYFLPAIVVLIHLGLSRLVSYLQSNTNRDATLRFHQPAALALMVALGIYWGQRQLPQLEKIEENAWCHFCRRVDDAQAIKDLSGRLGLATSSVITHDFGGFAWEATSTFMPVDYLGLCDHTLARADALKHTESSLSHRHRLQYSFHELEQPPTFVYLPGDWWKRLGEALEVRRGYYDLPNKELGESRRRGARFSIFRGAFIDYFAAVDRFDFEKVTKSLSTLGHRLTPIGQGELRVEVAITTDKKLSKAPSWRLRLERGDAKIETPFAQLFGGKAYLARQWEQGEPYRLATEINLPEGSGPVRVSLGLSEAGEWKWQELGEVDPAADSDELVKLPSFPNNLPAPRSKELAELRREVWKLNQRRRETADLTIQNPDLSTRLQAIGSKLEDSQPEQAYLAYVLALQADRSQSAALYAPIWELRPLEGNYHYSMAMELLQKFYSTGKATWGLRAAEYFAEAGDLSRARFLSERIVARKAADRERHERFERTLAAAKWGEPVDIERSFEPLDVPHPSFEEPQLTDWSVEGNAFGARPWRLRLDETTVSGLHGDRAANSYAHGTDRRKGELRSPEFVVEGDILSFMVGGGKAKRKVGVELHVDGESKAARTAHGEDTEHLTPVLWDVSKYRGKKAQITIYDRSGGAWGHVIADDFRWSD